MSERRFEITEEDGDYHMIDTYTDKIIGYDLSSPSMCKENWGNACELANQLSEQVIMLSQRLNLHNIFLIENCLGSDFVDWETRIMKIIGDE